MHAQGALNALKMALSARKDISQPLIHHGAGRPVGPGGNTVHGRLFNDYGKPMPLLV